MKENAEFANEIERLVRERLLNQEGAENVSPEEPEEIPEMPEEILEAPEIDLES